MKFKKQDDKYIISIIEQNNNLLITYSDGSNIVVNDTIENNLNIIEEALNQYKDIFVPEQISINVKKRNIWLIAFLVSLLATLSDLIEAYANNSKDSAFVGIITSLLCLYELFKYNLHDKEVDNLKKYKIYLDMLLENEEALKRGYPSLDRDTLKSYSIKALEKIKASLEEVKETIKLEKQMKENKPTRTLNG